MGVAPPPDGPPLDVQAAESAAASFPQQPADPTASLVGADLELDLNALGGPGTISLGTLGGSFELPKFPPFCGFTIPEFAFDFGFELPSFQFPPELPVIRLSLGINCSLSNPINVSAGVEYGGGRVGSFDPDSDAALDAAT